ncbi:MAG: lytic transglycosylase domain-containing protein [Nitrospirota bacterium]
MRFLILFVGVFFLLLTSLKLGLEKVDKPVAEVITDGKEIGANKARIINWMDRHSKMPVELLDHIYEEAHKHAFPELLIAIAKVESDFNPYVVSPAGAVGLTQIMPKVWGKELKQEGIILKEKDLFDVSKCMAASAYILTKYLNVEKGNIKRALKRYVGGQVAGYYEEIIKTLGEISFMKQRLQAPS